ncbi:MAG TPA: hypothetical protein VG796_23615 [Verrucomicrobiales bacterium]|jgi:hypothetical protein|nr:hypothetical protein [Verrucomicrobiales bacterium]
MPRRSRTKLPDLAKGRGGKNKPLPRREKARKLAARTVVVEQHPALIPVTRLYAWIGWFLLLPACVVTAVTLWNLLGDAIGESAFWRTPAFWFFAMGFVMWVIWFLWLPRPVTLYVWGHEMTHALCVLACGGKVKEFRVTGTGGHVITDRNNILIALSPYFFPLYTVAGVLAFLITGLFVDLTVLIPLPWGGGVRPLYGLFYVIGITWGFHLTFTVWMIARDQPDLKINGTFFSLMVIILVNLLIISMLLILAAPQLSVKAWGHRWVECGLQAFRLLKGG